MIIKKASKSRSEMFHSLPMSHRCHICNHITIDKILVNPNARQAVISFPYIPERRKKSIFLKNNNKTPFHLC